MRSFEEIDRDMAGVTGECVRRAHGCTYPACQCPRPEARSIAAGAAAATDPNAAQLMTEQHPENKAFWDGVRWAQEGAGAMQQPVAEAVKGPAGKLHTVSTTIGYLQLSDYDRSKGWSIVPLFTSSLGAVPRSSLLVEEGQAQHQAGPAHLAGDEASRTSVEDGVNAPQGGGEGE